MSEIDNTSSGHGGSGGNSLSWNHVLGDLGSKGYIYVGAIGEDFDGASGDEHITGITFNGVAMTEVKKVGQEKVMVGLYELHGSAVPVAGIYPVVVSYEGNNNARKGACVSFKKMRDQIREATPVSNAANGTNPLALNITPLTANALVMSVYGSQNGGTPAFSTGETELLATFSGGEDCNLIMGWKVVETPALTSVSCGLGNPENEALISASFEIQPNTGIIDSF